MSVLVRRFEVTGLHGRLNIDLDFFQDINVLYGRNGSGKTTTLHILANALNGDWDRFAFLRFQMIRILLNDERSLHIFPNQRKKKDVVDFEIDGRVRYTLDVEQAISDDQDEWLAAMRPRYSSVRSKRVQLRRKDRQVAIKELWPGTGASYFPAFRTMLEAWWSAESEDADSWSVFLPKPDSVSYRFIGQIPTSDEIPDRATIFARDLFGSFVPKVNYPSVQHIQHDLRSRFERAKLSVALGSEEILSDAFVRVFGALSVDAGGPQEQPEAILVEIESLLETLYTSDLSSVNDDRQQHMYEQLQAALPLLRRSEQPEAASQVLSVYRDSLNDQIERQRIEFAPIERYLQAVNDLLEDKQLAIMDDGEEDERIRVAIRFNATGTENLRALSSGERQLVSMLYAASYMSDSSVVLVDEPELSLHIDWQRLLLSRMESQLGRRQVIVCTHSPEIGADYEDRYQEVGAQTDMGG